MELSRRDILKMGGAFCLVAGASAALTGCNAGQANSGGQASGGSGDEGVVIGASDLNFTEETEILILGTGITGLATAMAPARAGKKVMLVEKLPIGGGESILSCGFMFFSGSDFQQKNGIEGTVDSVWEASKERLTVNQNFPESWYGDWIKKRTYGTTDFINIAINDYNAVMQKPAPPEVTNLFSSMLLPEEGIGNPVSLLQPIMKGLEADGAVFKYDCKAVALIKDSAGAIIGVRCIDQLTGKNVDIKAAKVAICTGGFANNQELVSQYLPDYAQIGNLTVNSVGEGQLMGFAAGAKMYKMDMAAYMMGSIPQATTWGYFTPMILVLQNGKRFINEGQSHDSGEAAIKAGFDGWWVIFDEGAFNVEQIAASVKSNIVSSADRYVTADTIEALAEAMKIDPATLAETFNNHNAMATAGEDTEFKKTRHLKPLTGKLHALRLSTRRYKTYGGFLTSVNAEVLDDKEQPIPNLYAAGSTVPWSTSDLSPNAGNGYFCGQAMVEALGA